MEKETQAKGSKTKKEFDFKSFALEAGTQALVFAAQGACLALGGIAARSTVDAFRSSSAGQAPLAESSNVTPFTKRAGNA